MNRTISLYNNFSTALLIGKQRILTLVREHPLKVLFVMCLRRDFVWKRIIIPILVLVKNAIVLVVLEYYKYILLNA